MERNTLWRDNFWIRTMQRDLLQQMRWSVLLPLDETPRGWTGEALSAPTSHKTERLLKWVYDSHRGLRQIDATTMQHEEGE